jgi:hypothetical protein
MGQYQQWLYHREVEQQLQARLEQILHKAQILQEQAAQLQDGVSCADNPILQAIALQQSAEVLLASKQTAAQQLAASGDREQSGVSPALFAWNHLSTPGTQEHGTPSTPHPEVTLLTEDMATYIDMHAPTTPRLHAARLVPQSEEKAPPEQEAQLDDRMDYSIQRWRERWGRQAATDQQERREDTGE